MPRGQLYPHCSGLGEASTAGGFQRHVLCLRGETRASRRRIGVLLHGTRLCPSTAPGAGTRSQAALLCPGPQELLGAGF